MCAKDFNRKILKLGILVKLHNPSHKPSTDPKYDKLFTIIKIKHKQVTIANLNNSTDTETVPDVWLEKVDI
jgi:hypothetical protein